MRILISGKYDEDDQARRKLADIVHSLFPSSNPAQPSPSESSGIGDAGPHGDASDSI
jgi:hypothetical protein